MIQLKLKTKQQTVEHMARLTNSNSKKLYMTALLVSGVLVTTGAFAQEAQAGPSANFFNPLNYLIIFTILILLVTIAVMAKVIRGLVNSEAGKPKKVVKPVTSEEPGKERLPWWQRLDRKLTDAVPIEKEADIMLDHDYDGIKELDNSLPPWWIYGFYLTIVFAVLYLLNYHVIGSGKLQIAEYEEQLADAEQAKAERLKSAAAQVDENTVTLATAEAELASGKKIYDEKCVVCHGKLGEGGVGPNMTDDYWIHGGSINDVFKVIKYGVPQKGMISWQTQLKPTEIQEVASYIKTLHGTNPPNPKEPQGDLYQENQETAPADSTVTASAEPSAETVSE